MPHRFITPPVRSPASPPARQPTSPPSYHSPGSDAKSLEVGNYIMGDSYPPSETSTDRTISLYRSGAEVADGLFMADDTLTVELSSTSNQYMFEIEGGTFTDTSSMTGCSSLRIRQTNNAEFVPDRCTTLH